MAKLLYVIICSLAVQCAAEMGRQRRWRMERRKKAAAKAAAERREREKNAPRDAESTSDGTIRVASVFLLKVARRVSSVTPPPRPGASVKKKPRATPSRRPTAP